MDKPLHQLDVEGVASTGADRHGFHPSTGLSTNDQLNKKVLNRPSLQIPVLFEVYMLYVETTKSMLFTLKETQLFV